jgi:hypothetical protein
VSADDAKRQTRTAVHDAESANAAEAASVADGTSKVAGASPTSTLNAASAASPVNAASAAGLVATADESLLDVIDNLLNRGVLLHGELVLGLADVDLVYARLSLLLCAADRILPPSKIAAASATRG